MTRTALVMIGLAAGLVVHAAAQAAKVTFIGHAKVAEGGTLMTGPDFIASLSSRTETGMSEVHDKETDTFYVVSGSATFITGGEMIGSAQTAPGQFRGSGLKGGEVHQLTKGDFIAIPAGVPHWFKEVQQPIQYYVVKIVKP